MKLYTRPRPLRSDQLRVGDQVALLPNGELALTELEYLDADLAERVRWCTVVPPEPSTRPGAPTMTIYYTGGSMVTMPGRPIIVREVVELDPWSYVARHADRTELRSVAS